MNSGIRFSVALIVVVVVLLGLYYAGLDDADPQAGDATSAPVEVAQATGAREPTSPTTTSEPEPTPLEPAVEPTPIVAVEEFDEFPVEAPGTTAVAGESVVESSPTEDDSADTAADGADEASVTTDENVELVADPESGDQADTEPSPTDDSEGMRNDPIVEEVETAEESAPVTTPRDRIDRSSDAARGELEPGRPATAAGVGLHRLASVSLNADLATPATRALAEAEAPGVIPGPAGSAWVPMKGVLDPEVMEDAIVGRVPGHDTPHVLLLTDRKHSVDLAGRVSLTEVIGSEQIGGWQVVFRLTGDAMEAVRAATRPMVGNPVAWIGGGRVIDVAQLSLPISGRGVLPRRFDSEAEADEVAAILMASPSETVGSGRTTAPDSTTGSRRPDSQFVVVGAGSLPLDRYVEYVVKKEDNFESIALWWFGDRSKSSLIAEANPLEESNRLQIGQTLRLPPKDIEFTIVVPPADPVTGVRTYRVRSGDTLGKIAQRVYGKASEYHRIHEANKTLIGEDPGNLKVGMELVIP